MGFDCVYGIGEHGAYPPRFVSGVGRGGRRQAVVILAPWAAGNKKGPVMHRASAMLYMGDTISGAVPTDHMARRLNLARRPNTPQSF